MVLDCSGGVGLQRWCWTAVVVQDCSGWVGLLWLGLILVMMFNCTGCGVLLFTEWHQIIGCVGFLWIRWCWTVVVVVIDSINGAVMFHGIFWRQYMYCTCRGINMWWCWCTVCDGDGILW